MSRDNVGGAAGARMAAPPAEGLFRAWFTCMTRPAEFFDRLDRSGPMAGHLLFFLVFWVLGSGLGTLASSSVAADWYAARGLPAPPGAWSLLLFFLSPFLGLLGLALNVGLVHLGVRLFVPGGRGIGVTARGLCYTSAPQVLAIVPALGWLVAPLWSLALAVLAVHRLHETSAGRAAAAVLVPVVAFALLVGTALALLLLFLASLLR